MQNFESFPILTTERLTLRRLALDDVDELVLLRSNEIVNKFLDRPKTISIDDAIKFINKIESGLNTEWYYWAITLNGENKIIGAICLWNIDPSVTTAEIGYELTPAYHGKGLMNEAVEAVISFGIDTLRLKTIIAYPEAVNLQSIKLLEKNNFKRDEQSKGITTGQIVYTLELSGINNEAQSV